MLKNVGPGLIENVKDLKIALNELTVHDLDVYSMLEIYYKVANKLNEVIKELSRFEGVLSDEVVKQNNKLIYLLGEGLENEVIKEIDNLIKNKFFDNLINGKIFSNILSELSKKANKDQIWTMSSMGQDVKEAMTGGSVAVVGKKSVDEVNLHSNLSKKLSIHNEIHVDFRYGFYTNDLTYTPFDTWMCGVINVVEGEQYSITGYNTNNTINLISVVNNLGEVSCLLEGGNEYNNYIIEIPKNCNKIYISYEISRPFNIKKLEICEMNNLKNEIDLLNDKTLKIYDGIEAIEPNFELGGIDAATNTPVSVDYCIRTKEFITLENKVNIFVKEGYEVCFIRYNNQLNIKSFDILKEETTLLCDKNEFYKITLRKIDDNSPIINLNSFSLNMTIKEITNLSLIGLNENVVSNKNTIKDLEEKIYKLAYSRDIESKTMNVELKNNNLIFKSINEGLTKSHSFSYFRKNAEALIFRHVRNDDWIVLGGDMFNTTAIAIGDPWSVRLIDLGVDNGLPVDIDIEEKCQLNDRIMFTWNDNTLIAKKDNGINGFVDWFSIDLSLYSNLKNYKLEKRFGVVTGNTTTQDELLMSDIMYSDNNDSLDYRIYKLENKLTKNINLVNKTWNAVGDSITQNNMYQPYVAEKTGVIPTSMKGLASSTIAINNSYLTNKSVVERVCGLNGNSAYEDSDIWTVFAGVNDWLYGTPVGSIDNKDNTTFYGALKTICENILLRENKPKLILFTPLQSNRNGVSPYGIPMSEYRKAIIEIGEYYSVPVLDLYSIGGLNPINLNIYAPDGIHPNDEGTKVYAPKIVQEMEKLY